MKMHNNVPIGTVTHIDVVFLFLLFFIIDDFFYFFCIYSVKLLILKCDITKRHYMNGHFLSHSRMISFFVVVSCNFLKCLISAIIYIST